MDCFSNADPVPNGRLLDALEPKSMLARAFDNYLSILADHTTYLQNRDDFVAWLSRELMSHARIDCDLIDPYDQPRQKVASARRQFRVGCLRVGRWVVVLAAVVATWAWWDNAPGPIGDAVAVVAAALNIIPPIGDLLAQHQGAGVGSVPGVALIILAAALWSLLLWLMWTWWNRNDTRLRYACKDFQVFDCRPIGFVALLIAGSVPVIGVPWLTGEALVPRGVTVVIAVLCAIVAVTVIFGITDILATLRAMYADGPLDNAAKRLDDLALRRFERGARQERGWAAF
jgi:hypothetical protein